MKKFITILFFSACICSAGFGQIKKETKVLLTDHYVKFSPNNNSIWFSNNGDQSLNPILYNSGWEYPNGGNKYICYESGLVIGGKVNGEIRIVGSTFRHALQGGMYFVVMSDGQSIVSKKMIIVK